jgi:hypothetical protein
MLSIKTFLGRRVTEDESDWKNYDPSQDEVVADIYDSGKNRPRNGTASSEIGRNESGIANLEIGVPRPMVSRG